MSRKRKSPCAKPPLPQKRKKRGKTAIVPRACQNGEKRERRRKRISQDHLINVSKKVRKKEEREKVSHVSSIFILRGIGGKKKERQPPCLPHNGGRKGRRKSFNLMPLERGEERVLSPSCFSSLLSPAKEGEKGGMKGGAGSGRSLFPFSWCLKKKKKALPFPLFSHAARKKKKGKSRRAANNDPEEKKRREEIADFVQSPHRGRKEEKGREKRRWASSLICLSGGERVEKGGDLAGCALPPRREKKERDRRRSPPTVKGEKKRERKL